MDIIEWDEQATLWLNSFYTDGWDTFFFFASKYTWHIVGAIILGFLFWKKRPKEVIIFLLFVAVMILFADQICNIFKHTVQRFRPCWDENLMEQVHIVNGDRGGKYGFFSAHAAISFGLAFLSSRIFKNGWFTTGIYIIAIMVSYSRIYLGRHFLGDVLVGAVEGTLVAWAAWYFYERFRDKLMKTHKRQNKK